MSYLLLILLIFILLFILLKKEKNHFSNFCVKKFDKTSIKLINHRWKDDFKERFKIHEKYTNQKIKELLPELNNNTYVIDVGSHVGDTGLYIALLLKKKWSHKNIKVIMIDPDKTKINFIEKMAKENNLDNIITLNYGVSDKKTRCRIFKEGLHPGGWQVKEGTGNINIDTLDNLCKGKKISLLHIDVEGMEYQCLKGSNKILDDVQFLFIELNSLSDRKKEFKLLKNKNFKKVNNKNIFSENNNFLFKK